MVVAIRHIEKALGSDIKSPSPSESKNISVARKSIHLCGFKEKGENLLPNKIWKCFGPATVSLP
jgi:sialic acid synthase SpsE